jgi:uncharacterized membrane protein
VIFVKTWAEYVIRSFELLALVIIVAAALYATGHTIASRRRGAEGEELLRAFRHRLARGVLAGLEALVAADIVKSAAVDLTFSSVGVLALIVLVRTFLSFTLELELTGRWPWQHDDPPSPRSGRRSS